VFICIGSITAAVAAAAAAAACHDAHGADMQGEDYGVVWGIAMREGERRCDDIWAGVAGKKRKKKIFISIAHRSEENIK